MLQCKIQLTKILTSRVGPSWGGDDHGVTDERLPTTGLSVSATGWLEVNAPEAPAAAARPAVFLDVSIGGAPAGTLVVDVYADKAPRCGPGDVPVRRARLVILHISDTRFLD